MTQSALRPASPRTALVERIRTSDRSRLRFRATLSAVLLTAVAVRLGPLLAHHWLGQNLEYDDGLYYLSAAHLLGGQLPYRDYAFLQPPGITLLLTPFAALGRVAGDHTALVLARLAMLLVAAANTFLVARLARRLGRAAALAAAAFYACWGGVVAPERTVLLEPLLNLALLSALCLLQPSDGRRRRFALLGAGLLLGAAMAVKIWAVGYVLVIAGWLVWRGERRAAALLSGAAAGAAALVCLPFFLRAPSAMFRDVLVVQLHRTQQVVSLGVRWDDLAGIGPVWTRGHPHTALALLVAFGLLALPALAVPAARLWMALLAVTALLVLPAPTFSYHYAAVLGPPLALALGSTVYLLSRLARVRLGRSGRPVAAAVLALALSGSGLLAVPAVTDHIDPNLVPVAELQAFLRAHPCSFTNFASLLVVGDDASRQVRLHCAQLPLLDYTGAALVDGDGRMWFPSPAGPVRAGSWQALVRSVMRRSGAAVRLDYREEGWSSATWSTYFARFGEPPAGAHGLLLAVHRPG